MEAPFTQDNYYTESYFFYTFPPLYINRNGQKWLVILIKYPPSYVILHILCMCKDIFKRERKKREDVELLG